MNLPAEPGQELERQEEAAHGADQGERRSLFAAGRKRRLARASRGAEDQSRPPRRLDREAEGRDEASRGAQDANALSAEPADFADGTGRSLDGDERARPQIAIRRHIVGVSAIVAALVVLGYVANTATARHVASLSEESSAIAQQAPTVTTKAFVSARGKSRPAKS